MKTPVPAQSTISLSSWLARLAPPLLLVVAGVSLYRLGYQFNDLSGWLKSTGNGAPFLFGLCGVLAMSMVIPKTWVSLTAGALFGAPLGCVTMLFTAVAAAALNYSLGRFWISRSPGAVGSAETHLGSNGHVAIHDALAQVARDAGFGIHLLLRLSPVPTSVISYSMGATRARFGPYLAAATVGVIPQFLFVYAASLVSSTDAAAGASNQVRLVSSILMFAVAAMVSVALPRIALMRLKEIRGGASQDPILSKS